MVMSDELSDILFETIQTSAQVIKSLISGIQSMNDGDLINCQKHTKEAQQLLNTMKGDVFEEFLSIGNYNKNINTYGEANQEELIRQLSLLLYDIGILLSFSKDESHSLINNASQKVATDIYTVIEIYDFLFNN